MENGELIKITEKLQSSLSGEQLKDLHQLLSIYIDEINTGNSFRDDLATRYKEAVNKLELEVIKNTLLKLKLLKLTNNEITFH